VRLIFQSIASTGSRLMVTAALFLTISLAARKMTSEEFGLWSILLSISFLSFTFDLGFRYGLSNRMAALVAKSGGQPDPGHSGVFLSVFMLQVLIAAIGAAACMLFLPIVPWAYIFNIRQADLASQMSFIMPVVGSLLFLNLPFTLWGAAFYANQEVTLASFLSGIQAVVLLGVFAACIFFLPFTMAVAIYFAAFVLTGAAITAFLFYRRAWAFRRVGLGEQIGHIAAISRPSLGFFVLSFSSALSGSISALLSGSIIGLKEAGDFTLLQKIFSLLMSLYLAFLAPLCPAYTRHAQLGDWEWVRGKLTATVRKLWPLVFAGGGILFVAVHPILIKAWTGKWLADYPLAALFAANALIMGLSAAYSVTLNSLGLVRFQGVLCLIMVVPVVILPLILGRWMGVHGVALAALLCALPAAILLPRYTAKAIDNKLLHV